jgi:hypothetical protein
MSEQPITMSMADKVVTATPAQVAARIRGLSDKGTSQQALDLLVKDWTKVFKEQGKQVASQ